MAAATRAITPTHTGPFSSVAPDTPTSIASPTQARLAKNLLPPGLGASASPRSQSPLYTQSPSYSPQLVAIGAMAEERRAPGLASPNAATAALNNLMQGAAAAAGLAGAKETKLSQPLLQAAKSIQIPDTTTTTGEALQTSPTSISSYGSINNTTATTATAPALSTALPQGEMDTTDPALMRPSVDPGIAPVDNRAFTYPPPPADDPRNPQRNMSMPNSGYGQTPVKSPSSKRHKCPYCATVFTRHHNLKSHLLTHSQEKPYECQQCQSRFRRLHDLKRHAKLHTGERPHECPKCGRKFARGDALARHNKGQGGCAGRRSSFGVDDDGEGRPEGMDGVEYTAEPEHMDDDEEMDERRRESEPSHRQDSTSYRQSSTYPPLSGGRHVGPVAQMYPPTGPPPGHESPSMRQNTASGSFPQYGSGGQVYTPTGVTESPKPISPGHMENQRGSVSGSSRNFQAYQPGRGGAPQLPPLPQLQHGAHGQQPGMPPPPSSSSHAGSMSSHSGSGGSTRELLGQQGQDLLAYVRNMETQMRTMQEEHTARVAQLQMDQNRLQEEYTTKLARLEQENKKAEERHNSELILLKEELSGLKGRMTEKAATPAAS
ncbi:hypothetical protein EJ06DRAFT_30832 [Trichodelitschia bisporula]|uniref:C2H2-type domain-containing protein n=1 Tax=Trichodelitschia bisporula TaxID=703511 RepID=A0A6G1IBT3_9PEZI|nr:hypothetical protein EJ06DRAFT_30832 [Trichodelitschia bisporula]